MKITTKYKYGFKYKGVIYGWSNKKLYRLPYLSNLRSYGLLEIKFYCFKSTLVCNIQRSKLTFNRLKFMTEEINVEVVSYLHNDMPF